jgi:hypothetical protein
MTLASMQIYCSELNFYALQQGAAVKLGQVQTVAQLNMNNFAVCKIIEARWQRDPLCRTGLQSFQSCFAKIQEQSISTPVGLANDPRLQTIYSNYGILR